MSGRAFDLSRILHTFFSTEKVCRRRQAVMFKLNNKAHLKST
ncbi:MAG: hypothetical protein ACI9CQ_004462 [Saprospiraceae bacterium]